MLARGRRPVKLRPGLARAARWLPALLWMGAIFYLSHQATPPGPVAGDGSAVPAHLALYAGLALLLYWPLSVRQGRAAVPWVPAAIAFSLAVLYGVTDELHQAFAPGRVASAVDLALDAAGAAAGVAVATLAAALRRSLGTSRSHAPPHP